ncbi:sensor histidine kinase [Chthonobacter albigriseus]|uniref:sensor histidine kinase n=1 Tax=Chthonobacter albigriseus TaxID=1683161 RepID=UPI0015EF28F7|nr:PAS domain-containing sensor histidine kinase [Chthonobacter albigriseus]
MVKADETLVEELSPSPPESADFLRRVLSSSNDCIAVFDLSGNLTFMSDGGMRTLEVDGYPVIAGQHWSTFWRTDDPAVAGIAFERARSGDVGRFQAHGETLHGTPKWWDVTFTAIGDHNGGTEAVVAVARDISDRRRDDEQRDLLSRELSHRIQNIFTVINSLITLSARADPAAASFAEKLKARLAALWKAHDYVRPTSRRSLQNAHSILGLASILLEAYPVEQISITGDDRPISGPAATALAMILHELATNAVKYGALSAADGRLVIDCRQQDDRVVVTWHEVGGPPVDGPPAQAGFGSTLATRTAMGQLGGSIRHDWRRAGLVVTIDIDPDELCR